jgi:hypothetical protein
MYIPSLNALIGRMVIVVASDITYRGILVEVSEDNVELQGEYQWLTIPVDNINSITEET